MASWISSGRALVAVERPLDVGLDARAAAAEGDVGLGADPDRLQVLLGDLGVADDVRRQRQDDVGALVVGALLENRRPRIGMSERPGTPWSLLVSSVRIRPARKLVSPSCRRIVESMVRVPMIGCSWPARALRPSR